MPAVSGPLAATNRPTAFAHDSQFLGGSSDSLSERATRCEAAVHRLRQVPVVVVVRLQGPPTVVPPLKALNLMTDTLCATCRRGSGVRRECTTHLWSSTGRWRDVQTSTVPRCRPHEVLKPALGHCLLKATTSTVLASPFPPRLPSFLSWQLRNLRHEHAVPARISRIFGRSSTGLSRDHLLRFLEHRIGDTRVLRLIAKWLNAGVMENDEWKDDLQGTPQGAVVWPEPVPALRPAMMNRRQLRAADGDTFAGDDRAACAGRPRAIHRRAPAGITSTVRSTSTRGAKQQDHQDDRLPRGQEAAAGGRQAEARLSHVGRAHAGLTDVNPAPPLPTLPPPSSLLALPPEQGVEEPRSTNIIDAAFSRRHFAARR